MPVLECRGLVRRPWLDNFNIALEPGEIAVLRGPSGSGKTLLLRTLADLDPCEAGEVRVDRELREDLPAPTWRARVMYLHQDPVRLPGDVRANLAAPALVAEQRSRGGDTQIELDLAPDTDIERISGGEAQRLALRRALALEPRVLLLDEATSALDEPAARTEEQAVSRWAREHGAAVLWVSHDDDLVSRLSATRVPFP